MSVLRDYTNILWSSNVNYKERIFQSRKKMIDTYSFCKNCESCLKLHIYFEEKPLKDLNNLKKAFHQNLDNEIVCVYVGNPKEEIFGTDYYSYCYCGTILSNILKLGFQADSNGRVYSDRDITYYIKRNNLYRTVELKTGVGSSTELFRKLRPNVTAEKLYDLCKSDKARGRLTASQINKYTESIAPYVKEFCE